MAGQHVVQLREITFATVRQVISLRVSEQQSRYVAPNATSIAEGLLNPGGWLRAIYAAERPVGFAMLFDPKVPGAISGGPLDAASVLLWRLMIDHAHQKRGYARNALDLLCAQARRVGANALLTSYVPGEYGPERFYLHYGFVKTGAMRANGTEPELCLNL
jgi:diamine N-acetyltransferase